MAEERVFDHVPSYDPDGEYMLDQLLDLARNGDQKTKQVLRFIARVLSPEESGISRTIIESGTDLEPPSRRIMLPGVEWDRFILD